MSNRGPTVLRMVAGKDATKKYYKFHGEVVLKQYAQEFRIGTVEPKTPESSASKSFFSRLFVG
jgi:cytochrome b involved in lipid metabolism